MKNILLLTVDSLRADYVFGSKAPDSLETLPRLIDEGIHCTNAFANASYTKQSFLSILSGTYPWMFDSEDGGYEPDRPHIAELLSEAGYATGGFHTNVYLSPTYNYDRGFDYYFGRDTGEGDKTDGIVDTTYNKLTERAVKSRGVSDVVHWVYRSAGKYLGIQLGSHLYKPAEELNDAAVDWARQRSQPAFIWIHYMDVHNPYYPHEGTVSEDISRRRAVKLYHRVNELRADASGEDFATLERLYRGEIEYLDRQLGDLLERLDEPLDLDNTLVAFSSDHGEAFNEKGDGNVFHPGYMQFDENLHIPIVFYGPGFECGRVDTPVSNIDIVPTLLSKAGIELPSTVAGDDVTTFVTRGPETRRVFAESFGLADGYTMVTNGRYKLIRDLETGEESLYDRCDDPKEVRDYIEEYPDVRAELGAALDEHLRQVERMNGRSGDIEVTEDVRLQLRKLGYDE